MAASVDVALDFTISATSLPLLEEPDLLTLPDDSQELMHKLSFCMKEAWHKIVQVILFHSKFCHGYFVSFPMTYSFRTKNVLICNGKGGPLCLQGLQHICPGESSLLWIVHRNCVVREPFRQYAFTAKCAYASPKCSTMPTSWLLCNVQYTFPTGARAQQQYHLNRGNFECLLHLSSLALKAFTSPYRAQLTHNCKSGLLWTLSRQQLFHIFPMIPNTNVIVESTSFVFPKCHVCKVNLGSRSEFDSSHFVQQKE